MMLDCSKSDYMPTAKNWKSWRAEVLAEIPAFLWWLLNRFEIPELLAHERYGVAYRNKRWEPSVTAPTPKDKETAVDELIIKAVFPIVGKAIAVLSATDLHGKLYGKDSPVREAALSAGLPRNIAYLGRRLKLWSDINNGRRNGYRIKWLGSGNNSSYCFIKKEAKTTICPTCGNTYEVKTEEERGEQG
jgi:hypothetical protein